MKRKGKNKSKDRQIIDFEENLDASTACSNVIATASNDINRSLSISNNNISSSSIATNNNSRTLSTFNNNIFSSSPNENGRILSTTNNNISLSSTNNNNRTSSTSNNNLLSSSTNNNNRILSISNNNTFSPPSNNNTFSPPSNNNTFSPPSNNNIFSTSSNNNNPALLSININPALLSTNIRPVPSSFYNKNSPGRKSTSNVWQYAKKSDDGKTAICLLCDYTCSIVSHSTSTILYHLIHKHNKYDLINNSSSSSTKPHLSERFKRDLHALCYNAIVIDSRSFNDLRKKGILAVFNKLCPGYTPPHRNQVSNQLKHLYNQHFQLLKDELKEIDYIGLTLDFWSSRSCISYLCVTGHYYKNQMEFNSKIIHFSSFNERHNATNIARCLKDSLTALEIYDKITAITCDGGENLVAACKKLDRFIKRIWCCTHRLHLVIVNALGLWNKEQKTDAHQTNNSSTESSTTTEASTSSITTAGVISENYNESMDTTSLSDHEPDDSLFDDESDATAENNSMTFDGGATDNHFEGEDDVSSNDEDVNEIQARDLIDDNWSKDVESDVAATEEVELVMKALTKCRKIATITKKSTIIANFIRAHKSFYKINKTINIDCKSRWNSTFCLIDSLIDAKPLLMKLFVEKETLQLRKEQLNKLESIELNKDDWDFLSSLHHVLRPFFLGTIMMSGKNYPSIGLAYHTVQKLKQFCTYDDDSNERIKELK
ncbi:unnamed protein product, partial [Rotaria sp. Silwood2]